MADLRIGAGAPPTTSWQPPGADIVAIATLARQALTGQVARPAVRKQANRTQPRPEQAEPAAAGRSARPNTAARPDSVGMQKQSSIQTSYGSTGDRSRAASLAGALGSATSSSDISAKLSGRGLSGDVRTVVNNFIGNIQRMETRGSMTTEDINFKIDELVTRLNRYAEGGSIHWHRVDL